MLIYLTYYLIKEMYLDKKIALISMLIFSVLWEHLFYSNRFHTENFALVFQFLALIVLIKSYAKKEDFFFIKNKYSLFLVIIFSIAAVMFRPGNIIFIPGIFIFLILMKGNILFKNKKNTRYYLSSLFMFFILFMITISKYSIPIISTYYQPDKPLSWVSLTVFNGFFQPISPLLPNLLFYFFLLGIFMFIFNLSLNYERLKNLNGDKENLDFKSDLLNILLIFSILILFIFFIRPGTIEYRWFFPLLPGMLVFTSKGIIDFSDFIGKKLFSKKIITFLIIIISLFGFYTQLIHADAIIKAKVDSYGQVRESGIWIKENSNSQDSIVSASVPQHSYYSERKVYDFAFNNPNQSEEYFNMKMSEIKPKYIVVSVFEPAFTPQWVYEWPSKNQDKVTPVKAYFTDSEKKQPVLVVYKFNYNYAVNTNKTQ